MPLLAVLAKPALEGGTFWLSDGVLSSLEVEVVAVVPPVLVAVLLDLVPDVELEEVDALISNSPD